MSGIFTEIKKKKKIRVFRVIPPAIGVFIVVNIVNYCLRCITYFLTFTVLYKFIIIHFFYHGRLVWVICPDNPEKSGRCKNTINCN